MDKIVSLCRRRGFVFPSSEIYGGLGSAYDYGHYGVLAKNNVKARWLEAMVQERDDIVALDSAIILHPRVWEASGHVAGFSDPLVDCRTCKLRFRADHLADLEHEEIRCGRKPSKRPGRDRRLRPDRAAPVQPDALDPDRRRRGERLGRLPPSGDRAGDLRQLQERRSSSRAGDRRSGSRRSASRSATRSRRGTSSSGRASSSRWRWSSSSRRTRPSSGTATGSTSGSGWYLRYGLRQSHLRVRPHDADELSHYSRGTSDIEYLFPIGWSELEGIANRGDYDLTQHSEHSGHEARVRRPRRRTSGTSRT